MRELLNQRHQVVARIVVARLLVEQQVVDVLRVRRTAEELGIRPEHAATIEAAHVVTFRGRECKRKINELISLI